MVLSKNQHKETTKSVTKSNYKLPRKNFVQKAPSREIIILEEIKEILKRIEKKI